MIIHNKSSTSKPYGLGAQAIRFAGLWVIVIIFFWLPISGANASEVTDENVVIKIKEANTAEDHQALEVYFNRKAAEAAEQVRLHEDMLQSYVRRTKADGLAIRMRSHCQKLIQIFRYVQDNYKQMAQLHGKLGKEMPK